MHAAIPRKTEKREKTRSGSLLAALNFPVYLGYHGKRPLVRITGRHHPSLVKFVGSDALHGKTSPVKSPDMPGNKNRREFFEYPEHRRFFLLSAEDKNSSQKTETAASPATPGPSADSSVNPFSMIPRSAPKKRDISPLSGKNRLTIFKYLIRPTQKAHREENRNSPGLLMDSASRGSIRSAKSPERIRTGKIGAPRRCGTLRSPGKKLI